MNVINFIKRIDFAEKGVGDLTVNFHIKVVMSTLDFTAQERARVTIEGGYFITATAIDVFSFIDIAVGDYLLFNFSGTRNVNVDLAINSNSTGANHSRTVVESIRVLF